ncbi:MAG: hypothetical protein ACYDDA_15805 [Acidiferrobacteraceae bacterium]
MRIPSYHATELQQLLERKKVCTLEELMGALGTKVRMTVFRKLRELPYVTSYSHRGKYYALKPLCQFDESGLWAHHEVWFSAYGTLLVTGKQFIDQSPAGYSAAELDAVLHVQTQQALLHLFNKSLVHREKFDGVLVYLAREARARQRQSVARRQMVAGEFERVTEGVLAHELKAAIILFFSVLDERQRRFFAGLESLKIGPGGDARIARLLGVDPHTVAKGRRGLRQRDIEAEGVRKRGSGRPSAEKKPRKSSPA